MLNRAARFFPILRELRTLLPEGGTLVEVGSGSIGLGEFWDGTFIGCDTTFTSRPSPNMRAVRCSGHQLPFEDASIDAVVVSDVLEHVPPDLRKQVIAEVLRVTRRVAVFGYPCGPAAFAVDQKLYREYRDRGVQPPVWLEEHMLHPFPEEDLLQQVPPAWQKRVIPNDHLHFHYWMMKKEMFRAWNSVFRLALRVVPAFVERFLERTNREPSYRKIFVLTRDSEATYA